MTPVICIPQTLPKAFNVGVNDLPLSLVLSWYKQKAVAILLTLLHIGIKDIRLGPTLPTFITPNVLDVLVKNFNIKPIAGTPEEDSRKSSGPAGQRQLRNVRKRKGLLFKNPYAHNYTAGRKIPVLPFFSDILVDLLPDVPRGTSALKISDSYSDSSEFTRLREVPIALAKKSL